MVELVFDPNQYLRDMAPKGGVATSFQEGQKAAADISAAQQQQRLYEQQMQIREQLLPLELEQQRQVIQRGTLQNTMTQMQIDAANRQLKAAETYAGSMSAGLPPYAQTATGAGLLPTIAPPVGAPAGLAQAESGGRTDVINQFGYGGRMQFGQDRLNDAIAAGVAPQGTTVQAFAQSPQLQQRVEAWHFNDINNYIQSQGLGKYVGQTVGGAVVTPQGMLAAAHLGGKAGLKQFLESGGRYNPPDQLGTTMASYMSRFGGVAAPSAVPTFAQGGPGVTMSTGGVPMAPSTAAGGQSGLMRDLTIGGLAEIAGGYPATVSGKYFAAPVSRGINYLFGTPERAAQLEQRDAASAAGSAFFNSPQVKQALYSNPELLQEAQQDPRAFYVKYAGTLDAPTPGAAPAVPAAPTGAMPTAPLMPGQPTPALEQAPPTAGIQEPVVPSSVVSPIMEAKPGAAIPPPNATTYLRNAPKINGDMQIVVAQDKELERMQKYMAQTGDIAGAAETGLKRIQLRSTFSNLQGLQAITNFDLGDNVSLSSAMSRSTGRKVGIQPLTNGNFNLLVDGQVMRSNVSRADVKDAAQYMLSESYRAQTMDMQKKQLDLQIELIKERAKTTGKLQEKQMDKLYEGVIKLQVERLKLSGFKVVEGEEGKFFVYKQDGSYAAYVDPEGKLRMPDGTEVPNTSVTQVPLIVPMTPRGQ